MPVPSPFNYGVYTSLNQPETRLYPLPKSLSQIGRGTLKALVCVRSPFSQVWEKGRGDEGKQWCDGYSQLCIHRMPVQWVIERYSKSSRS